MRQYDCYDDDDQEDEYFLFLKSALALSDLLTSKHIKSKKHKTLLPILYRRIHSLAFKIKTTWHYSED
jgi:hypothetical protein